MGLGTALNLLLSIIESEKQERSIEYETIEPFPLTLQEVTTLNYCQLLNRADLAEVFALIHSCDWNSSISLNKRLTFTRHRSALQEYRPRSAFHLIFYDAFAPRAQPELWTSEIFAQLYEMLVAGGSLITYCSKGYVRRNMEAGGFCVSKLKGPAGKREILRASHIA